MTTTVARLRRGTAGSVAQEAGDPRRQLILVLMCLCVTLLIGMAAAINLAVPKLAASGLRPSATGLLWIVDVYVLVFASLLIPLGSLGDRLGRKGTLVIGLVIFGVGCGLSALAPSVAVMLAGRALTGIGAAFALPSTLALVVNVFPAPERPGAIAVWSASTAMGGVLGGTGGGLVLQLLPWQGLFVGFLGLAAVLAVAVAVAAPETARHDHAQDPLGAVLLTLTLLALVYAIIEGPEQGWASATVIGSFAAAAVVLGAFAAWEAHSKQPMLDPRIFRAPAVRAGALGIVVLFFGMFGLFLMNSEFLQYAKGFGPALAGVGSLPLALPMYLAARRSVPLSARLGGHRLVAGGLVMVGIGLLLVSRATAATPYPVYAAILVWLGVGVGLTLPNLSTAILSSLPSKLAGLGSGLNSATREIGAALGLAVSGTVLNSVFSAHLPHAVRVRLGTDTSASQASVGRVLGLLKTIPGGAALHHSVVGAFTTGLDHATRTLGVGVLVLGILVVYWFPRVRSGR
jgi:MFS family permease